MSRFYCPDLRAFFDDEVNTNIPPTARPVSGERHAELMRLQGDGSVIVPDESGEPIAVAAVTLLTAADRLASIRVARDKLLRASDHTQMPDVPLAPDVRAAWATYRQALRDLPALITDFDQVEWPTAPDQ